MEGSPRYTSRMNLPIKSIALLIALSITCVALSGCGNKGPLVKPSDIPAATPVVKPAAAKPAANPAAAPASEAEPDKPATPR